MPTDKFFINADPTNFLNTTNWAASHGGTGSTGAPSNGDNGYIDYSTASIDGYDASALTFLNLYISKGYGRPTGSANAVSGLRIGSAAGTPLKVNATNLFIDNDVLETIILFGTFTNIYVNMIAPFCKLYLQGGGMTSLEAGTNGVVNIDDNVPVSRIESRGTTIKLGTYATLPPVLKVNSSRAGVESRRRITHGNINGRLQMLDSAALGSVNQVEKITMDAASTGGNIRLTIQKPDGTFATTANAAWNATDATYLAAINTQLDASSGVVGGIVATATAGVDPDSGFTLTYSGTGYAGLPWSRAGVHTFPTTSTAATYTPVRVAGSEITIGSSGVLEYNAYNAIGQTSSDIIRIMDGGLFDASRILTPIALNAQIIAMGKYKLSSSVNQTTVPRQPGEVSGGIGA